MIHILRNTLNDALKLAGRAVSKRSTIPSLAGVRFTTDGGMILLEATNLDAHLQLRIGAKVEDNDFTCCLPHAYLSALVAQLPDAPLTLKAVDGKPDVVMECAGRRATVRGYDPNEFPPLIAEGAETIAQLPSAQLHEMIRWALVSAATDEARPTLTGIHLKAADGTLVVEATDGYRLSRIWTAGIETEFDVIVPAPRLSILLACMADMAAEEPVTLTRLPNGVLFTDGQRFNLRLSLIEANFPDTTKIIPKKHTCRVTVRTDDLRDSLAFVGLTARDSANIVRFIPNGATLTLAAQSAELGDGVAPVEAETAGEAETWALNWQMFMDALKATETETVALEVTQPSRPIVLKADGQNDRIFVIMPMHTAT